MAATSVATLLLAGCGSNSGASGEGPTGEPVPGGTLTMIMATDGQDLDPTKTSSEAASFGSTMTPIFDTLVRVDADGTITPRLATEVRSTPDFRVWTITLREGVEFSDGTPFDAEAVKFNFERAQGESSRVTVSRAITSMTVLDSQTLELSLSEPNPNLPNLLMGPLGMIGSPTAIEQMGDGYSIAPVGAGPFVLERRAPATSITYVKNPNYWDEGKPYIDRLDIRFIAEPDQMNASFKAGEADILHTADPVALAGLSEGSNFQIVTGQSYGGLAQWFNNSQAPLDDVRVRRGLYAAMDPEDANQKAARGLADPVYTLFPESSPYYDADLTLPWNEDLAEAQEGIDEYIAEHGGTPLEIEWVVNAGNVPWATAFSQQIEQNLDNVTIKITTAATAEVLERLYSATYGIGPGTSSGFDPSTNLTDRLLCGSAHNNSKYCNPEMDQALRAAALAPTVEEKREHYLEVARILNEDVPFIIQARQDVHSVADPQIGGLDYFGAGFLTIENLWTSE